MANKTINTKKWFKISRKKGSAKTLPLKFILLLKSVFESNGAVKNKVFGSGILAVGAEVTHTQELEAVGGLCIAEHILNLGAGENFQRIGVIRHTCWTTPYYKSPFSSTTLLDNTANEAAIFSLCTTTSLGTIK